VFSPSSPARIAATYPPGPLPIIATSYLATRVSLPWEPFAQQSSPFRTAAMASWDYWHFFAGFPRQICLGSLHSSRKMGDRLALTILPAPALPAGPSAASVLLTEYPRASTQNRPLHPGKFAILAVAASRRNQARFDRSAWASTSVPARCPPE